MGSSNDSPRPRLYVFAISHYCEKARWALDYLGIDYELCCIAPGVHMSLSRKFGLPATSLPILVDGDDVVQVSADIIFWAEEHSTNNRSLTPDRTLAECREIEKRLDNVAGVHTRRYFYSETLMDYPQKVKPAFLNGINAGQRALLHVAWPLIRRKMIKAMDIGKAQGQESRGIVDAELSWLDTLLSDGRPYLCDGRFSRADVTAASLFARLAGAAEHPYASTMFMPPGIAADQAEWMERPSLVWIRDIYKRHRRQG